MINILVTDFEIWPFYVVHIVNLWLHALDGLHLSGNFDEWLSVIESLKDSGGEGLLDVLDGSGLGNGGIGVTSGLEGLGLGELGLEGNKELVLVHGLVSLHGLEELWLVVVVVVSSGGDGGVSVTSGLELLSLGELGLEGDKELVLIHGLVSLHSLEELWLMAVVVVSSGGDGGEESEFHVLIF